MIKAKADISPELYVEKKVYFRAFRARYKKALLNALWRRKAERQSPSRPSVRRQNLTAFQRPQGLSDGTSILCPTNTAEIPLSFFNSSALTLNFDAIPSIVSKGLTV